MQEHDRTEHLAVLRVQVREGTTLDKCLAVNNAAQESIGVTYVQNIHMDREFLDVRNSLIPVVLQVG